MIKKPSSPLAKPGKGESAEFAYRILKREIVTLQLAPNSDFDEAEISRRLGISRTPLREAAVRLAGEGLIRLLPNRGSRVTPMEWEDIREHLEAFEVSQRLVHRWAAVRRNAEDIAAIEAARLAFLAASQAEDDELMLDTNWSFHAAIARAARNSRVEQFYVMQLNENLRISRMAMLSSYYPDSITYSAHVGAICEDHDNITDAIRRGDAEAAEILARAHTELARKRVVEVLAKSLSPAMEIDLCDRKELQGNDNV